MSHPAKISRQVVVQTALTIIDEEGVGELSIGAIAKRLGIRGPSLYNHFQSKSEILSQVVRWIVLETPPVPPLGDGRWQDWLIAQCVNMRRAILRHPNAAGLLFDYFPRESMAPNYEHASKYLEMANVPADRHLVIFEGIDKLTLGSSLDAAQIKAQSDDWSIRATPIPGRQAILTSKGWDDEDLFVEVLRCFLDGVWPDLPGPRERTSIGVSRVRAGFGHPEVPEAAS